MVDKYFLSKKDHDELKKLLSFFKHNGLRQLFRRRNKGGGGSVGRRAFCMTAAGGGDTIACYLDTDETGVEITVTCNIVNGSDLSAAVPRLTAGLEIPVKQSPVDGELQWVCEWPFLGSKDCVCVEE